MSPRKILFRCSALGHLMTEPQSVAQHLRTPTVDGILAKTKRSDDEKEFIKSLKEQSLSAGAMTYIRSLVAQEVFGVDFEVSSKAMEKGKAVEAEAIALINRVRGLSLEKNTERRTDDLLTGEADAINWAGRRGHDAKSPWSLATFPLVPSECENAMYLWQGEGYCRLWKLPEWSFDYAMVDTPESLIGFEPEAMHKVGHIPERFRLTSWVVKSDPARQRLIEIKVEAARRYYAEVLAEFDATHAIAPLALAAPETTEAAELAADPFTA